MKKLEENFEKRKKRKKEKHAQRETTLPPPLRRRCAMGELLIPIRCCGGYGTSVVLHGPMKVVVHGDEHEAVHATLRVDFKFVLHSMFRLPEKVRCCAPWDTGFPSSTKDSPSRLSIHGTLELRSIQFCVVPQLLPIWVYIGKFSSETQHRLREDGTPFALTCLWMLSCSN